MAKKPKNPQKEALDRLLRSIATQAIGLALTKAPKSTRYEAFAALCDQAAEEARLLAEAG
jgi:hypothetical protein